MPSHTRENSRDRELVLRNQTVPISDPERAPPPLPMNPGSTSPATKPNVSPGIQAVAANFAEKPRENATSPYTTNPMPSKSPEKSLIKGQFHKRMQSLQNTDPRSEFLSYLENKSPERPQRASTFEFGPKLNEKHQTKSESKGNRDPECDPPNLLISSRYLSKPILGESTPPSATMLALQNMQIPAGSGEPQAKSYDADPFFEPKRSNPQGLEALSTQILGLTDIASNLQREMAQLSRRSKDNATDLVSLKAATSTRDEDIRKSLRDLSSNLAAKFLDPDFSTRWDLGNLLGSDTGVNSSGLDSSPNSKKSYSAPRMTSPSHFASLEHDICSSPTPVSDGSASIALLEKMLREMATKEGQEKLVELVDEIKARPASSDPPKRSADQSMMKMLDEILNLVKEESGNKALVRSQADPHDRHPQGAVDAPRSRSFGPDSAVVPDTRAFEDSNGQVGERSVSFQDSKVSEEMLSIMKRVKTSVIEGGGMTNEVKALVRELRGEVLGMGRNIARHFEQIESSRIESTRAIEDTPRAPGPDEITAIVNHSLRELRDSLASIMSDNRRHTSVLSELHQAVDGHEIYSIVIKALEDLELDKLRDEPRDTTMQKEDILETVREAWENYKPEIELQNFGLERDEILECLKEGLQAYQPQHEQAVTYDQVLAAVQAGVQSFEQPPSITREEIIQTIRQCFEESQESAPRAPDHEHFDAMRDEILHAVTESVTSQSALTRSTLDSGLGRDEILSAVSDGLEAHFTAAKEMDRPNVSREDITDAINEAFVAQNSAVSTNVQPTISREDIISAIAEGLENQNGREIELNKDDLMEAIAEGLHEATTNANQGIGEQMLERLHEHLDGLREDMLQRSGTNEMDTEKVLHAIRDGIDVVRHEIEGYATTATEAAGKHEIMDTVKEGFRLLQADMEKTITDTALSTGSNGNPDTPELLDAMEKEFEHLRQTLSALLIRNNAPNDKDEILDAIRDMSEHHKPAPDSDLPQLIKREFDNLHDTISMTLVRSEPTGDKDSSDRDEIIAALRESLENFREENSQPRDGGDTTFSSGEILEVLNDGMGSLRVDLAKILERPEAIDHSDLLNSLKEGLVGLKADVETLRESAAQGDTETSRGGELMLANDEPSSASDISGDIEGLKSLISQLQVKVEAIESTPRVPEPSGDALKREHLDEVLAGLHELQGSIAGIVARDSPADETTAKKEDTDAIETLLRNTKCQLDEMTFPAPDEIARAEQLGSLEAVVKETKEALSELSTRLEVEGPTKSEIGTLETLMKEMWVALDELKSKGTQEEEDAEKLVKTDLQTVEAMIFEVKTQMDELKIPDPETLPTKTELQNLTDLVAEFRSKTESDSEMTGQAFDARKVEHAGLAEKIDEARAVVEGLGNELRGKLDGSSEGLCELKQLLEGLAVSAEGFSTVDSINELTELINREFERARGEQDASKLQNEERDAASMVKHDETRAAIIVELGEKIDEKLGELMEKYHGVQTSLESKFTETAERDNASLEAVTSTKSLAEDIKLVIGSMGNSVNETCERMSVDAKTFFEKVDTSYTKMEEMHNEVKSHQEQSRSDLQRAANATDRLESKLHEFHPQVLESIQEILSIVNQHYDHSQQSAKDIKMDLSTIPASIPQMLPALPPPEPEKYDDTHVREKLDSILEHAKNEKVHEALNVLVERVTSDQVHEKLDQLLSHTTSTNGQMYEKLSELLDHATSDSGPVHDKLDTLIGHATNTEPQVTQMMKLDEMHKDIMETHRKMNEMFTAQSAIVAEDNDRKRREAEEAAVALERRNAQREQVEAELVTLKEEKDSLLSMIGNLKSEKETLAKQNAKLNKELSGLEMALDLRHEEMQVMEERADSLEKRILEGVLDHARSVLLSRPNGGQGIGMKKARGLRARGPSNSSTATATPKDVHNLLGSSVGLALKKRVSGASSPAPAALPNASKERRILSLGHVTANRGVGERRTSATSGLTNLKRSHSVKSNLSYRKSSWGGRSSVANKENEAFPEEDENRSGDESDAGTERRTSYTGTYTDSMIYGTGSAVSAGRTVSAASNTTASTRLVGPQSVADDYSELASQHGEEHEQDENDASDIEDALTTKKDNPPDVQEQQPHTLDEETSKMVLYGQYSDSGLGAEISTGVD
ncbi:hypothetical protein P168DRAFT_327175 [Aspergillus campestris IBT 28561]|uniref:Chromosome segregation ATPase family protein n=1 Tax=Aspergillus campestris (strain IBT 28561) TaxID=1392248 RepID=A0A2I1D2U2_ASPC2|nr:uncharacterized protein P168DRAFT_327175 [Aspergillus campestris IBT 28561]PKY04191.1 hypothetical protein P168DRAFT_327175 [Aspergillus campestris IBT 28561]